MVGLSHPCKIYGAMAAARPILLFGPARCHATDIIGDHDVGWHVAHGDVDAAVAALAEIRDAPAQRLLAMGSRARELVRRHYAKEALCGELCEQVGGSLKAVALRRKPDGSSRMRRRPSQPAVAPSPVRPLVYRRDKIAAADLRRRW